MSRRHRARIHDFAIGSSPAAVAVTDSVVRCDAGFGIGKRRRAQQCDRKDDAEHSISLRVFGWVNESADGTSSGQLRPARSCPLSPWPALLLAHSTFGILK